MPELGDGFLVPVLRPFQQVEVHDAFAAAQYSLAVGVIDHGHDAIALRDLVQLVQWLEQPGYPVLDLSAAWDGDAGEMVVTVRQVQQGFEVPSVFV